MGVVRVDAIVDVVWSERAARGATTNPSAAIAVRLRNQPGDTLQVRSKVVIYGLVNMLHDNCLCWLNLQLYNFWAPGLCGGGESALERG